ncbi:MULTISPECIES: tape measure protein [unclassified Mesorhizobium]|uniref:tape measure protein n=1 Tax=unclassified Mesorhizobium TaxID=325217 RepID=UPI002414E95C|nr:MULTISPECIES: tape measure protein [unclassified Mesorhizobium]MDG4854071.1 tape measure protein [Mesorhizobium sp. WSM4982]MDG4910913.1 tape measure protein [Mesorhizobium sp. WSM4983]
MASDVEKLLVQLEAKTTQFNNALNKANRTAQTQLRKIETQFAQTNKKLTLSASFAGVGNIGGLVKRGTAGLAAALATDKIKDYADAWTTAGNKIAAASVVSGQQARSLDDLNKLATVTRSGLGETVDLYAKLLKATSGVAKSEQEVADATEIVNKAFKAGGAEASEQAAGILQLSQALSSGLLQGDELRSIRENAPLIAQAIANEFKTTIGGLKQLGADGKLTVDRVFKAILDAKPLIDKAFNATNATIGDNIGLVNNALTAFIGKLSDVTGAGGEVSRFLGQDLVAAINGLSAGLDELKKGAGVGYLEKVANVLNRINEIAQGLKGGIVSQAFNANVDKSFFGTGGNPFQDMLDGLEKIQPAFKEVQALDAAFADFRDSVAEVKPEAVVAFDALQSGIDEGTVSAKKAKQALRDLFGDDPMYSRLLAVFDELLDKLQKVEALARASKAGIDTMAPDPRAAGFAFQHDREKVDDFFDKRNADAKRSDLQKEIDERAAKIVEAAGKVGVAITDAAAKIQAAKELADEEVAKSSSKSIETSVDLIKEFEGFISKPKWDVNAFRAGYGSDTVTLADGSVQKITQGMSVSITDANRDLVRRIGEFQDTIKRQIGADTFASFDQKQQAALTSIAYNYGSLPDRIVDAIKTGNQQTVVEAIRGLGGDNGGINRARRNTEADVFLGGAPSGVQKAVKGQDRFNEKLSDTQLQIDLLNKEAEALGTVNPLINDYGYAQSKAEIKQRLLNDAMDNGVEITPEYAAKIDELAEKYAQADAARNQMQQGVENLSEKMAASSAFGKDLLGGFIRDLRDGKSASEAFANALGKVADKLLDMALNALFDGGGIGSTPGGGILGGLFKFLFADGGYTGAGGKNEPAGIVHKGEVVFSQDDVKRFGGPRNVERMRRGYADGGIVGFPSVPSYLGRIPTTPRMQRAANDNGRPMSVSITVVTPDAHSFVESQNQIAARTAASLERTMRTR